MKPKTFQCCYFFKVRACASVPSEVTKKVLQLSISRDFMCILGDDDPVVEGDTENGQIITEARKCRALLQAATITINEDSNQGTIDGLRYSEQPHQRSKPFNQDSCTIDWESNVDMELLVGVVLKVTSRQSAVDAAMLYKKYPLDRIIYSTVRRT
jgi:hypothetical protein